MLVIPSHVEGFLILRNIPDNSQILSQEERLSIQTSHVRQRKYIPLFFANVKSVHKLHLRNF